MPYMLIDAAGVGRCALMTWRRVGEGERHYFACPDRRAIIVVRVAAGSDGEGEDALAGLIGKVCDVTLGWDRGDAGFVFTSNVGKRHSKATLFKVVTGDQYDLTLSQFLDGAPKSNERG